MFPLAPDPKCRFKIREGLIIVSRHGFLSALTLIERLMMPVSTIHTPRLHLRHWRDTDLQPFAAMNADPRVMDFISRPLDRGESDARAAQIRDHFAHHEFGLSVPQFEAHFTPCVEIGWRLAYAHWGHGYATEAARAVLEFGFRRLGLEEIVSFTVPANKRSRAVMERIGMTRSPSDDFDHPILPENHPLRRHVLYRTTCPRAPESDGQEPRMK
jgi:RimJ/RimL family protein N-acetyltransferase